MDYKKTAALLLAFAADNKDKWNEMDAAQGDGDLGLTILLGARALLESSKTSQNIQEWFELGGKSLRKAAPSTMGILIASALIEAGKTVKETNEPMTLQAWVNIQQCMVAEIMKRGGAQLGDKTVLDAFIPAVEAFSACSERAETLENTLTYAADAARKGAENTKLMVSKIGRSSWLGERAQGNIDGGALVCYQVYELLASKVSEW